MKTLMLVVLSTGLLTATGAFAQDGSAHGPPGKVAATHADKAAAKHRVVHTGIPAKPATGQH
jgi:hypothetical protein